MRNPNLRKRLLAEASRIPVKHHLDRRAPAIIERGNNGAADDLLPTPETAAWLGVSVQWLEIGRHKGYGPRFVRCGPRRIRYRRADVLSWLAERTHAATAEYAKRA